MAGENRQSSSPPGVPSPWEMRFPDDTVSAEKQKVNAAVVGLVIMSVIQILIGILHMPDILHGWGGNIVLLQMLVPNYPSQYIGFALFAIASGSLIVSALLARVGTLRVALIALCLTAMGLIVLLIAGHFFGAIVTAGAKILTLNAVLSLRRLKQKIHEEAERNPLVAHYRLLVRLLVRMMVVDHHVDRREADTIMRVCNSLRISKELQVQFVEEALEEVEGEGGDLDAYAERYLELAEETGIPHAQRTAIMAAVAVAAADGVIGDAEEAELSALGRVLQFDPSALSSVIVQHRTNLGEMTQEVARELLGVDESSPSKEIEAAYRVLASDLERDDYNHLGEGLADYAEKRRAVVDKAYDLLTE